MKKIYVIGIFTILVSAAFVFNTNQFVSGQSKTEFSMTKVLAVAMAEGEEDCTRELFDAKCDATTTLEECRVKVGDFTCIFIAAKKKKGDSVVFLTGLLEKKKQPGYFNLNMY